MKLRKRMLLIGMLSLMVVSFPIGAAAQAQVPHYFPDGIERLSEPGDQLEAYKRYIRATNRCRGSEGAYRSISGDYSRAITEVRTIEGKEVSFYFEPWIKLDDGGIVYYDFCGQEEITDEQFQVVKNDIYEQFDRAVDLGFDYYEDIEELAVSARAVRIGVTEADFRARLDEEVPEAPGVTYRELQQLPRPMTRADFVPNEVHIGYGWWLGVAWPNGGVMWITPQARILDYINGEPQVLLHELVHTNANLQNFPILDGVDAELIASIPSKLLDSDYIRFHLHGYMRTVRNMVEVYFGYDFKRIDNEIFEYNHAGNWKMAREKTNEYLAMQAQIKPELRKAFKRVLQVYYSDPIAWAALHDKLGDSRGVFHIVMSMLYDPTIVENHRKTMEFVLKEKPEIKRMAHKAYQESGKADNSDSNDFPFNGNIDTLEMLTGMNQEELLRLAEKHGINVNDLRGRTPGELIGLYMNIMDRENADRAATRGRLQ